MRNVTVNHTIEIKRRGKNCMVLRFLDQLGNQNVYIAKGGELYHHERVTWLGGSLFYPSQLIASRVNSSSRFFMEICEKLARPG